jgi:hypothetical protein
LTCPDLWTCRGDHRLMQNTGGDQAGLFTLISAVAAVVSAIVAGLTWMRATEANAIVRRALESQTATRVNVRCRRGGIRPFVQAWDDPPEAVLVVGENVGGLLVTIDSVWVMFRGRSTEPGLGVVHQTEYPGKGIKASYTGKQFQVPELPYVLEPHRVLQVPMTLQWLQQALAGHDTLSFVLRLQG